jgi:hypothetical protein
MANSQRGEVEVQVGDRIYTAKLDYSAIMCLETYFGSPTKPMPIQEVLKGSENFSMTKLAVILWATLTTYHREDFPTLEALGSRLDLAAVKYYSEKITEIFQLSQPAGVAAPRPTIAPVNGAATTTAPSTGPNYSAPPLS